MPSRAIPGSPSAHNVPSSQQSGRPSPSVSTPRSHAFATGGGGGTAPDAARGSSIAYTFCGLAALASLTHSTSLFLISGCQLWDRPNVTGSHSTSPGAGVGRSNEPNNEPNGRSTGSGSLLI